MNRHLMVGVQVAFAAGVRLTQLFEHNSNRRKIHACFHRDANAQGLPLAIDAGESVANETLDPHFAVRSVVAALSGAAAVALGRTLMLWTAASIYEPRAARFRAGTFGERRHFQLIGLKSKHTKEHPQPIARRLPVMRSREFI